MAAFFRLVQARWAAAALSGEGARLYGGRWNPPGVAAVYLAESRALAALEVLVHAPREALGIRWSLIEVEIAERWIETLEEGPPEGWETLPSSVEARKFGAAWLREKRRVGLRLPSVAMPKESVLLVNPGHPRFAEIRAAEAEEFWFDPRLRGGIQAAS